MLMAQLRGKFSTEAWIESEDLLTSAVIGTLKNLDPTIAADLLALAQPIEGAATPALTPPLLRSLSIASRDMVRHATSGSQ